MDRYDVTASDVEHSARGAETSCKMQAAHTFARQGPRTLGTLHVFIPLQSLQNVQISLRAGVEPWVGAQMSAVDHGREQSNFPAIG